MKRSDRPSRRAQYSAVEAEGALVPPGHPGNGMHFGRPPYRNLGLWSVCSSNQAKEGRCSSRHFPQPRYILAQWFRLRIESSDGLTMSKILVVTSPLEKLEVLVMRDFGNVGRGSCPGEGPQQWLSSHDFVRSRRMGHLCIRLETLSTCWRPMMGRCCTFLSLLGN